MFQTPAHNNDQLKRSGFDHQNEGSNLFVQPKLNIGKPGDQYEVEADKAADQIVAKGNRTPFIPPTPTVQKQTEEEVQQKASEEEVQQKPVVDKITPGVQLKPMQSLQQQPEEEVQTKEDEIQEKEISTSSATEEAVQTKSEPTNKNASGIENQLSASKGGGQPMDSDTRSEMESGFGTDFSGVRVHNDSNAADMNNQLGSQAFTNGNDIYFNEGKYNPQSDSGKHLLAHELTHTVQQGASPSVQPKTIQKAEETPAETDAAQPETVEMQPETGVLDEAAKTITFSEIGIPGFKLLGHRGALYNSKKPLKRKNNYTRGSTNQRNGVWKEQISTAQMRTRLTQMYQDHYQEAPTQNTVHVFKANIGGRSIMPSYIGSLDTITKELSTPVWGKDKQYNSYDVDHIVELQLANWGAVSWPNTMENMELLESRKNSNSGVNIKAEITNKLSAFRERHSAQYPGSDGHFKNQYTLVFDQAVAKSGGDSEISDNDYWTKDQIVAGNHLDAVEVGSLADFGSEDEVRIFPNETGGLGKKFKWSGEGSAVENEEKTWFGNPFRITAKNFNTADGSENTATLGTLSINIRSNDKTWQPWEQDKVFTVHRYQGSKYAGYLTKQSIKSNLYGLRIKKASPVEFKELDLGPNGIEAYGEILPTIPIFEGNPIELTISNGEVRVSKTFPIEHINVPAPFEISNTSLTIFASSENGLGLEGQTDFKINQVGEGSIRAQASTGAGFELAGEFNFDSKLFDPAKVNMEYKDNIWTIGGEIGIPEGKVRGIKSATITAEYSEGQFRATGDAELDIPGIERGSMEVNYGDDGFAITGDFALSSDIPGISGGNVSARLAKQAGQEDYDVMVSGTAQPDIPGINSQLTVTYENGALTIEGSAQYSRGMLSGEIMVGATNKAIGDDGQPSGEPDDTMRVYGGGSLTLQLTPWLAATAGVRFLPNGEMEVTARLDAPRYDVFPRQEVNKNLFTVPTIEIPLFAIPLGPKSIGLVAQIGGGLDFTAGFGPGHIRNVSAEITYNPDREEETTVTGHGEFAIPADAGLTLRGDLSIGASIAIASITGGIELAGSLGLAGEALASVDLGWTPQTGLEINAMGSILVSPKFVFDINAFIRGTLGIGWLSISETWRTNLASYEWGPGIEFGIKFPVNYKEGEAFSMSLDDIELVYPELDIPDMATGIASDVKDALI